MKAVPIERIQVRIADLDRRIASLEQYKVERQALVELLRDAIVMGNGDSSTVRSLGPTRAVLDLAGAAPGLRQAQIVGRLVGRILTTSNNPSRILYSTIANLRRNGKLVMDDDGGLRLADREVGGP